MDFRQPRGRTVGARVERGDPLEVLGQVPAERRVDVHARRDAGIHLFLNEAGVKVSRIQGHETHVGHSTPAFLSGDDDHAAGGSRGHEQDQNPEFHGPI